MIIIGSPNKKIVPFAYLEMNGQKIEITSANITMEVGVIPTCRIEMIPEFYDLTNNAEINQIFRLYAGDREDPKNPYLLFTGYKIFSSVNISMQAGGLRVSFDMIHKARDLDWTSTFFPDIHQAGQNDWEYEITNFDTTSAEGQTSQGLNITQGYEFFPDGSINVPRTFIQKLSSFLDSRDVTLLQLAGSVDTESNLQITSSYLKEILNTSTIQGSLYGEIAGRVRPGVDFLMSRNVNNSGAGKLSIWETLKRTMAEFEIVLSPKPDGTLALLPHVGSFQGPPRNTLTPDFKQNIELSTRIERNIREVIVYSADGLFMPQHKRRSGQVPGLSISVFPRGQKADGASFVIFLPQWLNDIAARTRFNADLPVALIKRTPVTRTTETEKDARKESADVSYTQDEQLVEAIDRYAEMMFYVTRSQGRTAVMSGPMTPTVYPGTTMNFTTRNEIKSKATRSSLLASDKRGYCHRVQHVISASPGIMQTIFTLTHVSDQNEPSPQKHPVFSDAKPIEWD